MMVQSETTVGKVTDYSNVLALGRRAEPQEPARFIKWLLSDEASYITGTAQQIDGGWFC
jgi:NAD(P)-dependent dehydrogenase (short-subunit alcohol dehydrogenase family)